MVYYLLFLAIAALFLLAPLGLDILYLRNQREDKLIFTFKLLWGALKVPVNVEKTGEEMEFDLRETVKKLDPPVFGRLAFLAASLKGRIKSISLTLRVELGLGDAAATGVAAGVLWAGTGALLVLLRDYLEFAGTPRIAIIPDFGRSLFLKTRFFSSLEIRMASLLKALLLLLAREIRSRLTARFQAGAFFKTKMKEG